MDVPLWVWLATIAAILIIISVDFVLVARRPREPSLRESALWVSFYATLAVLFGIGLGLFVDLENSVAFFTGWIVEYSLSIDNLFILILIISSFMVPQEHRQRVILIGIVLALLFRAVFIALGAAAVETFIWTFYIFGAILLVTAVKLLISKDHSVDHGEYRENIVVRLVRSVFPTTDRYHGARLTVRIDGRRHITPMLLVIIAIGLADIVFALDSIPAIFGITQEPYLVFTANAFALMGLRQLYFLLGGLLNRLIYLNIGLALVLGYIGVTLLLHSAGTMGHLPVGEPNELVSLTVVVGILTVTTIASLVRSRSAVPARR
ncbi:TerC/Alx family metal homeostasis membrane protein [Lipingzhangella sp. LS1_29]|uniref:TerC/Alx family metal homeostasis membrane protein n=1 Tax=Lipingzhangella rawalii TaxID=2055835 RepID=A0ABU2H594_9ACTN|nr:TerC/Alx family metal homeostasis membrane protein [Lipingzhangella rawalii]MDS1270477.1 TerC/Alx family metal homeostasis membrane protein [Lipingzhangella rawalii]